MKNYLYCIHYIVKSKNLQWPEVYHTWFNEHPDDEQVKGVIEIIEGKSNASEVKHPYYYLVYDATKSNKNISKSTIEIMIDLEKHIMSLHELGGIKVIPYEIVLEYIKSLEQQHAEKLEKVVSSLGDAINTLNENID